MADGDDPFADFFGPDGGLKVPEMGKKPRSSRSRSAQPVPSRSKTDPTNTSSHQQQATEWPPISGRAASLGIARPPGVDRSFRMASLGPPSSTAPHPSDDDRKQQQQQRPTAKTTSSSSSVNPFMVDGPNPFMAQLNDDDDDDDDTAAAAVLPPEHHRVTSSLTDEGMDFDSDLAKMAVPVKVDSKRHANGRIEKAMSKMEEMGYKDKSKNLSALVASKGDFNLALDIILGAAPHPKPSPGKKMDRGRKKHHHKQQRKAAVSAAALGDDRVSTLNKSMNNVGGGAGSESSLAEAVQSSIGRNPLSSSANRSVGSSSSSVGRTTSRGSSTRVGTRAAKELDALRILDHGSNGIAKAGSSFVGGGSVAAEDLFDMSVFFDPGVPQETPQAKPGGAQDPRAAAAAAWSDKDREKHRRTHSNVVKEMVETERTYLKGLEKLISFFVYPLQGQNFDPALLDRPRAGSDIQAPSPRPSSDSKKSSRRHSVAAAAVPPAHGKSESKMTSFESAKHKAVIDRSEAQKIFSNVELIYRLNKRFLDSLVNSKNVNQVFNKMAQFFKMYTPYIQNHNNATEQLKSLTKARRSFRNAKEKCEKEAGVPLASLLILPIQRIPRYELLLGGLIKSTHPSDGSYQDLHRALDLIKSVAVHINQSIHAREDAKKLQEIQSLFHGNAELVAPHRKFIMRQRMKKMTKSGRLEDREFFLFTDMLAYGSDDTMFSDKFRLRQKMKIDKSFLVTEVQRLGPEDHLLYVSSAVKNITIFFEHEADKNKWKSALTKCMEERRKKIGYNYDRRGSLYIRQSNNPSKSHVPRADIGPAFTSFSYGSAAEEDAKTEPRFYKDMQYIEITKKYFESLLRQTKVYLHQQLELVKGSNSFAIKLKGEFSGLGEVPWYRALDATSNMVAVHSQEMLRWKSVTELMIDTITWLLHGPIRSADRRKDKYEKHAYELHQARRNLDHAAKKKNAERILAAGKLRDAAAAEHKEAKATAKKGVLDMNVAIQRGFITKLKLFVQVQADFHKDCYYDIRQCWAQVNNAEQHHYEEGPGFLPMAFSASTLNSSDSSQRKSSEGKQASERS